MLLSVNKQLNPTVSQSCLSHHNDILEEFTRVSFNCDKERKELQIKSITLQPFLIHYNDLLEEFLRKSIAIMTNEINYEIKLQKLENKLRYLSKLKK